MIKQVKMVLENEHGESDVIYPVNTSEDVVIGKLENGELKLPGDSSDEILKVTLENVRKILSNLYNIASKERIVQDELDESAPTDLPSIKALDTVADNLAKARADIDNLLIEIDKRSLTNHAVSDKTNGAATYDLYGHVKLADTLYDKDENGNDIEFSEEEKEGRALGIDLGMDLQDQINARALISHVSDTGENGKASIVTYGHTKLSNDYLEVDTNEGIAASQKAIANLYANISEKLIEVDTTLNGKAPTNHANSDKSIIGGGTATMYGHVKLTDTYTSSAGAAIDSIAISSLAAKNMYDDVVVRITTVNSTLTEAINTTNETFTKEIEDANIEINKKAPIDHASEDTTYGIGTSAKYGHAILSDAYNDVTALTNGVADKGMAASSYALYQAYNANKKSIETVSGNLAAHLHDSRYFQLTGTTWTGADTSSLALTGAVSGYLLFSNTGTTNGVGYGIGGINGTNDSWVIRGYQSAGDSGALEIAVGDDGNEGIYVRQYTSGSYSQPFAHLAGTASDLSYRQLTLMAPNTGYTELLQLSVSNNITAGGTLGVTGKSTLGELAAGTTSLGATTVSSLTDSGNATIKGTLGVTGKSTLGELAAGTTSLGATTVSSLTDSGNATIKGTLGVTGKSTLGELAAGTTSLGATTVSSLTDSGNAIIKGTLGATGKSTLGELAATTTSLGATTVSSLTDSGNAIIKGTLGVTGTTTLSSMTASSAVSINGTLTLKANSNTDSYSGALNLNNSNIYGLNSLYTADISENASEGIHFYRDATHVDTFWISGGNMYFVPNREIGTGTTAANSNILLHSGNYTQYVATPTGSGASGTWGISITGNAATATKLATARTIALTGSVTGSGTFDGSGNLSITTTTSHTHSYAGSSSAGGAATSAVKLATARTIALTGSVTGSGSFDGSGNLSIATTTNHTHNYAGSSSAGGAANSLTYFQNTSNSNMGQDTCNSNGIGYITDYSGTVLTSNIKDGALYRQVYSTSWAHEIYGDYRSGSIALRGKNNGTWQSWKRVFDEGNYTNWVPTKTGSGASGTWGISITGNAATATKLATARTIALTGSVTGSGKFDGSGNLSIATTTNHTHSYAGSSSAGGAATSAVKLATARTINGTSFDGTRNITTSNWGTARNISIADSDASNTGSAVSVNGSVNATLKLPANVKYSNVYATSTIKIANKVTLQYNSSTESLDFVF